jgi:NAD(P)H-dependent FMN reductase
MITLISGTNRPGSLTYKLTRLYQEELIRQGQTPLLLDLAELPPEFLCPGMYSKPRPSVALRLQDTYFIHAEKFVLVFPEYNGSFPGILKLMIDGLDPRLCFDGKKAGLFGVSTGRAGNLRGMDHLSGVMHYLKVAVMPRLTAVPHADQHMDSAGLPDAKLHELIADHCRRMIAF